MTYQYKHKQFKAEDTFLSVDSFLVPDFMGMGLNPFETQGYRPNAVGTGPQSHLEHRLGCMDRNHHVGRVQPLLVARGMEQQFHLQFARNVLRNLHVARGTEQLLRDMAQTQHVASGTEQQFLLQFAGEVTQDLHVARGTGKLLRFERDHNMMQPQQFVRGTEQQYHLQMAGGTRSLHVAMGAERWIRLAVAERALAEPRCTALPLHAED